jgi:streptogramin lyase
MHTASRLLLSVLVLASSLAAQTWQVDTTKIHGAVQDSSGQVWGFGMLPDKGLYRWDSDKWLRITLTGMPEKTWPWTAARGPDGSVYFLWSDGAGNLAVSRHLESDSRLLVCFAGRLRDRPRLFVDPGGNIWITEQGRHIFRVTPQGKAECIYTFADNQFLEAGRPASEDWTFNPIYATADGQGRVWFWSNSLAGRVGWASLAGVLVFDGKKFEHHSHLAGIPDKKISVIEPDGAKHLWLAVIDDQLYRVDTETLVAAPAITATNASAFRRVRKIFQSQKETYIVEGLTSQPVPGRDGGGRFNTLWEGKGGTWKRLIDGLDMRPESIQQTSRPFLATGQGLWIGGFGNGPWLIPAGRGSKELIDWHYGYPLDGSEGLFQLPDGRLLMVSENHASLTVKPADLLAGFQSPPEFSMLNPLRVLTTDTQGHFWGILDAGDNELSEWDGQRWINHPIPSTFTLAEAWNPHPDSLGRIWLPFNPDGRTEDPLPYVAWIPNFLSPGRNEVINVFGRGFGTNSVVTLSARGVTCTQTYRSDTQITCDLTIPPDVSTFRYSVMSQGYNGLPFVNGLVGMGVGIYDPKSQSFKTYVNYDQALEAQLPMQKDFRITANLFKAPSYSGDGRICYRETRTSVRYFDGGRWREWSTRDVSGLDGLEFRHPPFFDRSGNLAVNLHEQTWEFTDLKGWQPVAAERDPAAEPVPELLHSRPAPPACAAGRPESLVQDRLGTYWFTSHTQLYRAIGGQCVAQFGPNEHQPFVDSRKLQDVLIDPRGNAFLMTQVADYYGEYAILKAHLPQSRFTLRAVVDDEGRVLLHFGTGTTSATSFTWKIDGGPWNTPTKGTDATLEELPNGQHHIQAVAVDDRLQMDLTPSEAVVDVHVDLGAHILELIRQLANPDYSIRDKAVAALLGRGAIALPLLQSAREHATPDQQWWIDATMQQINEGISTYNGP